MLAFLFVDGFDLEPRLTRRSFRDGRRRGARRGDDSTLSELDDFAVGPAR